MGACGAASQSRPGCRWLAMVVSCSPIGGKPTGGMAGLAESGGGACSGLGVGDGRGGSSSVLGSGGRSSSPGPGGEAGAGSGLPSGGGAGLYGSGLGGGAGASSGLPSGRGGELLSSGLGAEAGASTGLPSAGGGEVSGWELGARLPCGGGGELLSSGLGASAGSAVAGWGAGASAGAGARAPPVVLPLSLSAWERQVRTAHAGACRNAVEARCHAHLARDSAHKHAHLQEACRPLLLRRHHPPCSTPDPHSTYIAGSRWPPCRWRSESCGRGAARG